MKLDVRSKVLLGAALTGMLSASTALAEEPSHGSKKSTDVECSGVNSCKGKGQCGSASHSCAGLNECKGKGWLSMSKEECKAKGGTFKEETKK